MFMSRKGDPIRIVVYNDGRWYSDKNDWSKRARWLKAIFQHTFGIVVNTETVEPGIYTFNVAEDSPMLRKIFDLRHIEK